VEPHDGRQRHLPGQPCRGGTTYIDDGKPLPGLFEETLRNLREISPTYFANVPAGYAMLATALEKDDSLPGVSSRT